jgi:predicted nucleic acid-binding protein
LKVYFIDTNIPIYASGKKHPYKEPCQKIIFDIADHKYIAFTNTEVFQEIIYRYFSINELSLGHKIFESFYSLISPNILSVNPDDVLLAQALSKKYNSIKPRDLLHAATMINNNIEDILSTDREFDTIKEINRIDPLS